MGVWATLLHGMILRRTGGNRRQLNTLRGDSRKFMRMNACAGGVRVILSEQEWVKNGERHRHRLRIGIARNRNLDFRALVSRSKQDG